MDHCIGPPYWVNLLGQSTGPIYWANLLGHRAFQNWQDWLRTLACFP
ncbi:MAG: hypothetical protein ACKO7W_07480 [Elainella sp.]